MENNEATDSKNQIGYDWQNAFPDLTLVSKIKLYKIVGPLIIGIDLTTHKMRITVLLNLFFAIITLQCNEDNQKVIDGEYERITSAADSTEKMAVIYRSIVDSNKVFVRSYWDDGGLQGIGNFYKGLKHGYWAQFYKGIVTYEGNYLNGQKHGTQIYFSDKGDTSIIEHYKMGEKIGRWMYFDSLGMPFKAEEYSDTLIEN